MEPPTLARTDIRRLRAVHDRLHERHRARVRAEIAGHCDLGHLGRDIALSIGLSLIAPLVVLAIALL